MTECGFKDFEDWWSKDGRFGGYIYQVYRGAYAYLVEILNGKKITQKAFIESIDLNISPETFRKAIKVLQKVVFRIKTYTNKNYAHILWGICPHCGQHEDDMWPWHGDTRYRCPVCSTVHDLWKINHDSQFWSQRIEYKHMVISEED